MRKAARQAVAPRQEERWTRMITRTTNQIQTAMGRVKAPSDQQRPVANQLHVVLGCQTIRQTPATSNNMKSVSVRKSEQRRMELGSRATSRPAKVAAAGRSQRRARMKVKEQVRAPRKHWTARNRPRRLPPSLIRAARKSGYTGVRATLGSMRPSGVSATNPFPAARWVASER